MTVEERFWAKVDRGAGCWQWQGARARSGYGLAVIGTHHDSHRYSGAHRVAYELLVGPIPEGLEIDHLCGNRVCVNPAHLEPVTHQENMQRGVARRTRCRKGHEYTPATMRRSPSGHRVCRPCERAAKYERPHEVAA